jgi:hypothetical protein
VASIVGWLDYSEEHRQKMREIIDLFKDEDSIDELGLRSIRDPLADMMFPGLSTIQTRARYFILVPWVYRRLEDEKVPSSRAKSKARDWQYDLVKAMQNGGVQAGQGVIGWDAGRDVQRLPTDLYWNGLRTFGIRQFSGSIDDYHRSLDSYHDRLRHFSKGEGDEVSETFHPNWNSRLPPPPPGLWNETTIDLSEAEGRFLSEQIIFNCRDSLLAHLVAHPVEGLEEIPTPWDHPAIEVSPSKVRETVEYARLFAQVMQGAAFAYNLMLAQLAKERGLDIAGNDLDDYYTSRLAEWAGDMNADPTVRSWDTSRFWAHLAEVDPHIPPRARAFAQAWISETQSDPVRLVDLPPDIRGLISNRERQLKKGKARLQVHRALEMWSGGSGTALQTYRWPTARTLLADIHRGLGDA